MKQVNTIILLLFLSLSAFAQEAKQDIVYLKNGSVLKGAVIEMIVNESIKIQLADGSIFAYPTSEVEKITKEVMPVRQKATQPTKTTGRPNKGYRAMVDAGGSFGVGFYRLTRFEMSFSNGYQFNPHLYLGGGLSGQVYTGGFIMVGAFGNARGSMPITGNIAAFLDTKIGYSVGDAQGFSFSLSPGVRFKTSEKCAVNAAFGYSLQNMEGEFYYNNNYIGSTLLKCHALSLKVGFEF